MQNLESLVSFQDAQIRALKKKMSGAPMEKSDTLIVDLTINGRSAAPPPTQGKADALIVDLTLIGKSGNQNG